MFSEVGIAKLTECTAIILSLCCCENLKFWGHESCCM